jgi:hypothetical protein
MNYDVYGRDPNTILGQFVTMNGMVLNPYADGGMPGLRWAFDGHAGYINPQTFYLMFDEGGNYGHLEGFGPMLPEFVLVRADGQVFRCRRPGAAPPPTSAPVDETQPKSGGTVYDMIALDGSAAGGALPKLQIYPAQVPVGGKTGPGFRWEIRRSKGFLVISGARADLIDEKNVAVSIGYLTGFSPGATEFECTLTVGGEHRYQCRTGGSQGKPEGEPGKTSQRNDAQDDWLRGLGFVFPGEGVPEE